MITRLFCANIVNYLVVSKNRGDRIERLAALSVIQLRKTPLISSVVTADPFDDAIAEAFVRLHLDNPFCLHPNGVENESWSCPSFHSIVII